MACRPVRGRLSTVETDCAGRSIVGGTEHVRHETALVHHAAERRGGSMADRGAGGAVGDVLRYWLPPCGCRMVRSHAVARLVITGNWLPDAAA
jgi:hypothetical protein